MKHNFSIRRLFHVQYRLTVFYNGTITPYNTFATKKRILRGMTHRLYNCQYWSLYKAGPFNLPEREIDCSLWHNEDK